MNDAIVQAYSLVRIAIIAVIGLLALFAVLLERRERKLSVPITIVRALVALAVFVVLLVSSGLPLNWLWAAVAAVAGIALGFLSGRSSKIAPGGKGSRTIKRAVWPMLVLAASYVLVTFTLLYATTGLFLIAMLFLLLGATMLAGAAIAEVTAGSGEVQPSV